MKTFKKSFCIPMFLGCTVFFLFSCEMNPDFVEKQDVSNSLTADPAVTRFPGPVLSFPISMNRVDLYTNISTTLTGTVTVQITNSVGGLVGSTTVWGASLIKGEAMNTFYFPSMTLMSGQKYRINLIRSNAHYHVNDYLYWRSTNGPTDVYPKGSCYFASPPYPFDMAFRTFSDGYLDQQQTVRNYGFAIGNTYYAWQEFVPSKIWVIGS